MKDIRNALTEKKIAVLIAALAVIGALVYTYFVYY